VFFYHATLFSRMTRIAVDGLRPRRGHSALFYHGSYGSHKVACLYGEEEVQAAFEARQVMP